MMACAALCCIVVTKRKHMTAMLMIIHWSPPPFAAAQLYYVYVRYLGDRAFVLRRFNTHVYVRAIYVIVTIVVGHIPACQVDCQASTNVLQRALKICSFSAFMETM